MAKNNYAKAIKDFEALEARYPYGEYSHAAQLALINAYYKKGDYPLALSTADRFIRMNPRDPQVDYAYYLKGLVSYDQNSSFMYRYLPIERSARDSTPAHESFLAFKDLVDQFPNSQYAPEARQRMIYLRNQLAAHELHIANYYMKREAYIAATNRADYIVKNYERTTAVPKALCTMVIAYRCLGMIDLSEAAQQILDINFPGSKVNS